MARLSITADLVALSTGSIILAGLAGSLLTNQAGGELLLNGSHQPLLQGILGTAMVLWPLVRRVGSHIRNPANRVAFAKITHPRASRHR